MSCVINTKYILALINSISFLASPFLPTHFWCRVVTADHTLSHARPNNHTLDRIPLEGGSARINKHSGCL